jgi:hypothetical protein
MEAIKADVSAVTTKHAFLPGATGAFGRSAFPQRCSRRTIASGSYDQRRCDGDEGAGRRDDPRTARQSYSATSPFKNSRKPPTSVRNSPKQAFHRQIYVRLETESPGLNETPESYHTGCRVVLDQGSGEPPGHLQAEFAALFISASLPLGSLDPALLLALGHNARRVYFRAESPSTVSGGAV